MSVRDPGVRGDSAGCARHVLGREAFERMAGVITNEQRAALDAETKRILVAGGIKIKPARQPE